MVLFFPAVHKNLAHKMFSVFIFFIFVVSFDRMLNRSPMVVGIGEFFQHLLFVFWCFIFSCSDDAIDIKRIPKTNILNAKMLVVGTSIC